MCDGKKNELESHVIVMSHVVHFTIKYLDDISKIRLNLTKLTKTETWLNIGTKWESKWTN